jgi:hypothetical protein
MSERETALQRLVNDMYDLCTLTQQELTAKFGESRLHDDSNRLNYMAELLADCTTAAAGTDPVPVCQWREIATAPKGTLILLCSMTATELRHSYFVDWLVDGRLCSGKHTAKPTHWMPLPAPPVALVPAEGEKA